MTIIYLDSSAVLKRVIVEGESAQLAVLLRERSNAGDLLTASSLTWLEVWRALRRASVIDVHSTARAALSGVAEFPLSDAVLTRARHIGPEQLRSLDAVHLASAVAVSADAIVTYDERLAAAANSLGIEVRAPSPHVPFE